jgi:hypothetical protein
VESVGAFARRSTMQGSRFRGGIANWEERTAMIRSKSLFAFPPARTVAVLCGVLDSSAWLATYDYGSYFALYYAFAVSCKALILLIFIRTVRPNNARLLRPVCFPVGIAVGASIILGITSSEGVIQPIGTLISLALTIMVLSDENITAYMKAFGVSCFMACLAFLFQLKFGDTVWTESGRYTFIYGTQPNLGGEILFAGFIAFCFARLNTKLIFGTFALYCFVISLLEARAAMLSMLIAFSLYVYVEKIRRFAPIERIAFISILGVIFVLYCALNWDSISNLFLLDDSYRGAGTGVAGRGQRWENAWNTFLQFPLFGVGFGYFSYDLTPHSMWLGMLSTMGLMSFFIFVAILQNGWRIYSANIRVFFLLISFIPMTIFNDRILNLNPYPFLLFVLLFLPSKALAVGIQGRELRPVRHGGIGAKTA